MKLVSWLMTTWFGGDARQISVGSRVKLPTGDTGVVSRAAISVDLDVGSKNRPVTATWRVNYTYPIDKIEII